MKDLNKPITRKEFLTTLVKGAASIFLFGAFSSKTGLEISALASEQFKIPEKPFRRADLYSRNNLAG
jgi:hypothetical protein